jgi:hypothetical protein
VAVVDHSATEKKMRIGKKFASSKIKLGEHDDKESQQDAFQKNAAPLQVSLMTQEPHFTMMF